MPFVSRAQQKWAFAHHMPWARKWAHETPDLKHLPEYRKQAVKKRLKKRHRG